MARSLFCFVVGVLTGVALAESTRWVREHNEARGYEALTDKLSDKLESLERNLPNPIGQ